MKINLVTIIQKPILWIPALTRLVPAVSLAYILLSCAPVQAQQTIQWQTNMEQAQQLAKEQNKLILVHFTASWSRSCRNLANFVHSESRVQSAFRDNIIAVKIDVDQHPELVEHYEVPSVPFEIVLTAEKKVVSKRKSPDNSSAYFKMVSEWAVLLNDSGKVNHAIADMQNLDKSKKNQFQGKRTSFLPTAPTHALPSPSPESAKLRRRFDNSAYGNPLTSDNGFSNTTVPSQPIKHASNDAATIPIQGIASRAEPKPISPNKLGSTLPSNQVPENSSAFSGANYQTLAKKTQQQGFIQVPTGQIKKNPFFVQPANNPNPTETLAGKPVVKPLTKRAIPQFEPPTFQPLVSETQPKLSSKFKNVASPITKPATEISERPSNDFRPPNPPLLSSRPSPLIVSPKLVSPKLVSPKLVSPKLVSPKLVSPKLVSPKLVSPKLVSPKPIGQKPKLENQFKPAETKIKSPLISPKQLLAEDTNSVRKANANSSKTAKTPEYALRGKCSVSLLTQGKWINGDPKWGCVHRNQVYIFGTEANLKLFKENPEAYSPILAGFDPVVFHESGKLKTGLLNHGVFMGEVPNQRIILFSDAQTCARFQKSPKQFLETVRQAMEQTDSLNQFRR
jgi:thiol-disulfide isomerase/thioredoxin